MLLLICVPIAYVLVRNRPEDVGLLPDGEADSSEADEVVHGREEGNTGEKNEQPVAAKEDSWTLSDALKTKAFWFLAICGAIPAMINTGVTFQLFSILGEQGITRTTTAFVLSLIPLVSFGCSILSGFIVERVKVNRMLAFTFVLSVGTPLILMVSESYAMVLLFAISWGVAQGMMNIPFSVIWPSYYGRQYLGSIQSITHASGVIGSAVGPILFGWGYDRFGNYDSVLIASSAIFASGAMLAFLAKRPRRKLAGKEV